VTHERPLFRPRTGPTPRVKGRVPPHPPSLPACARQPAAGKQPGKIPAPERRWRRRRARVGGRRAQRAPTQVSGHQRGHRGLARAPPPALRAPPPRYVAPAPPPPPSRCSLARAASHNGAHEPSAAPKHAASCYRLQSGTGCGGIQQVSAAVRSIRLARLCAAAARRGDLAPLRVSEAAGATCGARTHARPMVALFLPPVCLPLGVSLSNHLPTRLPYLSRRPPHRPPPPCSGGGPRSFVLHSLDGSSPMRRQEAAQAIYAHTWTARSACLMPPSWARSWTRSSCEQNDAGAADAPPVCTRKSRRMRTRARALDR
jgi:hypothetical protein